jgi:hypothetical protein
MTGIERFFFYWLTNYHCHSTATRVVALLAIVHMNEYVDRSLIGTRVPPPVQVANDT